MAGENESLRLSDFHYELPEDRIAQSAIEPRDHSKLLFYQAGKISHHQFYSLAELLPANCLLVFNDTKVIHARIFCQRKSGAKIELFLLSPVSPADIQKVMNETAKTSWQCLVGNKKKWKEDEILESQLVFHGKALSVRISWNNREKNIVDIQWDAPSVSFSELLSHWGKLPLPPYIRREAQDRDEDRYQTIYARNEGAVAAPTAGLHFSESVYKDLQTAGISIEYLTLHVGAGTFLPVKEEEIDKHHMHEEKLHINRKQLQHILTHDGPIIPVGTTSLRVLESLYWFACQIEGSSTVEASLFVDQQYPYLHPKELKRAEVLRHLYQHLDHHQLEVLSGETQLFIKPGYYFRLTDGLITNFHMPETTLIMLVAALTANDWKKIYASALEHEYRFLSYGDSSLLIPRDKSS